MIKADIVKEIARNLEIKDKEALTVVDGLLESMKEVICQHRRLEMRDFGVFQIKTRKERIGRNPQDKVEYPIPARQVVNLPNRQRTQKHRQLRGLGCRVNPDCY